MININRYTLSNGLRVIHNEDNTTQMVALNLLYDVGARDEDPDHTGFAHLFEHLMFGGSVHVPDYDTPVQNAGGENNAWTNNDITNYYITLPVRMWKPDSGWRVTVCCLSTLTAQSGSATASSNRRVQTAKPEPAIRRRLASATCPGL